MNYVYRHYCLLNKELLIHIHCSKSELNVWTFYNMKSIMQRLGLWCLRESFLKDWKIGVKKQQYIYHQLMQQQINNYKSPLKLAYSFTIFLSNMDDANLVFQNANKKQDTLHYGLRWSRTPPLLSRVSYKKKQN